MNLRCVFKVEMFPERVPASEQNWKRTLSWNCTWWWTKTESLKVNVCVYVTVW